MKNHAPQILAIVLLSNLLISCGPKTGASLIVGTWSCEVDGYPSLTSTPQYLKDGRYIINGEPKGNYSVEQDELIFEADADSKKMVVTIVKLTNHTLKINYEAMDIALNCSKNE